MTIEATRWDPALVAPADRTDAWVDTIGATHLPWALDPGEGSSARDELACYRVGDLALVDCRCGPFSGSRGRSQLAATTVDAVGVLFVRAGEEEVEAGGDRVVVRPGSALVWRSDEPVRFRVPGRLHKWTLLLPRARVPGAGRRGVQLLDGPAVGLLASLLGTTMGSAGSLDGRLGASVADAAVDLLGGALDPGPDGRADPQGVSAAAWLRVTEHVRRHLSDPELTPARMAAAGLMSQRSLYAMFAERGDTPAGYVRRRRLDAARRTLERRGTVVTVAAVAHGSGFRDQATFSRAFRAAYGRTPDDVRRGTREARLSSRMPRSAPAELSGGHG
jgi:AraC-like DNA-binding protein